MTILKDICNSIVKEKAYPMDNQKKKVLYPKILNVEQRMFDVYMKSGKSRKDNFPFESLGKVIFMNQEEITKVAKTLFDVGWKPEIHVTLVRKRFKNISYIGQSITF